METQKLLGSLEKEGSRCDLFEKKNAKLETDNDNLRIENQELIQTVNSLTEQLNTLKEANKSSKQEGQVSNGSEDSAHQSSVTTDPQTGISVDPIPEHSSNTLHEVKTLRKVKRELEKELKDSKSSTLSFQASFQAEFDLRTQTEQRLEHLRERYERMVIENDKLRSILTNNVLQTPSSTDTSNKRPPHPIRPRATSVYSGLSYARKTGQPKPSIVQPRCRSISPSPLEEVAEPTAMEVGDSSLTSALPNGTDTSPTKSQNAMILAEESIQHNSSTSESEIAPSLRALEMPRADTLVRNAQGYLSRMEKLSSVTCIKEDEVSKEENDEKRIKQPAETEELEEMLSVSPTQLDNAKAFCAQVQAKRSSFHDLS